MIESLFEDWILTNKNIHPLAVENMRLLEADALALLKEQEPVVPDREQSEYGGTLWDLCGNCRALISPDDKYCHECGRAVKWE
jgi:hypothetical protein